MKSSFYFRLYKLFHFLIRKLMHISVAKFGGSENVLTVEIASDLLLKDLKAVIEAESDFGIKADEMSLYYEGKYRKKRPVYLVIYFII